MGDLALAQDIETGDVAYKPVLLTTERPPSSTLVIKTDETTVRCSGGHPFWVVDEGWARARQLRVGQQLHGLREAATIREIRVEPEPTPTYNLVVADFHNYFVGADQSLTHDNSSRRATAFKRPGERLAHRAPAAAR